MMYIHCITSERLDLFIVIARSGRGENNNKNVVFDNVMDNRRWLSVNKASQQYLVTGVGGGG